MEAPVIKGPVVKSAGAIAAAVGVNTDAAGNVASATAAALAPTSDPLWYWFVVSLPWDKIASLVAAVYTTALFSEWPIKRVWRSWVRPCAVRRGWVDGEQRLTRSQWAELTKDE